MSNGDACTQKDDRKIAIEDPLPFAQWHIEKPASMKNSGVSHRYVQLSKRSYCLIHHPFYFVFRDISAWIKILPPGLVLSIRSETSIPRSLFYFKSYSPSRQCEVDVYTIFHMSHREFRKKSLVYIS